jgi:hypothetical protein
MEREKYFVKTQSKLPGGQIFHLRAELSVKVQLCLFQTNSKVISREIKRGMKAH